LFLKNEGKLLKRVGPERVFYIRSTDRWLVKQLEVFQHLCLSKPCLTTNEPHLHMTCSSHGQKTFQEYAGKETHKFIKIDK
jgi:hypothetical protein